MEFKDSRIEQDSILFNVISIATKFSVATMNLSNVLFQENSVLFNKADLASNTAVWAFTELSLLGCFFTDSQLFNVVGFSAFTMDNFTVIVGRGGGKWVVVGSSGK